MKNALIGFVFIVFSSFAYAQVGAIPPDFNRSIKWEDSDSAPNLTDLRGKSVIVVFFQSWCPKCNAWSKPLFNQLGQRYENDPKVVVIALKTDGGSLSDARKYLNARTQSQKIILGIDNGGKYYNEALGNKPDDLYNHMWIKPNGAIGSQGSAGRHYPNGKKKDYSLASKIELKKFHADTKPIFSDKDSFGDQFSEAQKAAESGNISLALKLSKKVNSPEAAQFRAAIASHIQSNVNSDIEKLNDPKGQERFLAYKSLQSYAQKYSFSPFGIQAKEAINKVGSEPWLRNENNAERSFKSILDKSRRVKSKSDVERVQSSVTKFIDQYSGTYYASIAEGMLEKGEK